MDNIYHPTPENRLPLDELVPRAAGKAALTGAALLQVAEGYNSLSDIGLPVWISFLAFTGTSIAYGAAVITDFRNEMVLRRRSHT